MRSFAFSVLLLSSDHDLHEKIQRTLKDLTLTMARDVAAIPRSALKQGFDAVLIEARRGVPHELAEVSRLVEPSRAMIVMGSRSVLTRSADILQTMTNGTGRLLARSRQDVVLEEIIESKLGEFVKGMRNGSARNLHPMLISAVERPLIAHALRETNGNQIQAAHLLGMNRNTLRKKITEFKIPVKRQRIAAAGVP
ncbi:MAG TPA: helix-turn-helix domain-containing protein [Nitrospiraceae bacterium]|nr:helix-turn-helix domain-containing protein [Nitrospiraceae bacterium]